MNLKVVAAELVSYVVFLKAVGHCMFLKEEEWFEMIQKFSVTVACQKGDILISMKEPNPNLYRVQSGRFSLHRSDGKPFKFVGE